MWANNTLDLNGPLSDGSTQTKQSIKTENLKYLKKKKIN